MPKSNTFVQHNGQHDNSSTPEGTATRSPPTLNAAIPHGYKNEDRHHKDCTTYPPLEAVTRPNVDTAAAAYYLCRKQQTLRGWACHEDGPIRPIRINGRLAWSVATLRILLGA